MMKMRLIDGIECYGDLDDSSNFSIVCDDEEDDGVWCEGNPDSANFTFESWEQVVETIRNYWAGDIIEISAV